MYPEFDSSLKYGAMANLLCVTVDSLGGIVCYRDVIVFVNDYGALWTPFCVYRFHGTHENRLARSADRRLKT